MAIISHLETSTPLALPKCPSGIQGLDEITGGGLPKGRPTLICGSAGCGKTLLAMEFLARGATEFDEPGVFMAFEETADELAQNVRSLHFDLDALAEERKLLVDYVYVERSEIEETGQYDLEGLFVRLGYAIDSIGAKRVVLDTLETLFSGLSNDAILRSELRRLVRWLKDKGVTAMITAERGDGSLTRHGLEEYVSDCVIMLDHRVTNELSTRRLRIIKYRGSTHGTNEFPFLIDEGGISVLPITSAGRHYEASSERISTGVAGLDAMLGGQGYYRGSSILVSGNAGTGKTSLAAHFADASARRGERCLCMVLEESQSQVLRNMRSVGLDLEPWIEKGLLQFYNARPSLHGLEMHLAVMHKMLREFQPRAVIVDPLSAFLSAGSYNEVRALMMRLVDLLKAESITALLTTLVGIDGVEDTNTGITSLIDTWLLVRDLESNGERNRGIYVLKSRGMAHSNQVREFLLTDRGIELTDVYVGPEGILTGSARTAYELRAKAELESREEELEIKRRAVERKRTALDAQVAALEAEFEAEKAEFDRLAQSGTAIAERQEDERQALADSRKMDGDAAPAESPRPR